MLYSKHFMSHNELTDYVNATPLAKATLLYIVPDSANGGWVLWWWV